MASGTEAGVTISIENNIQVIRFNNPFKKNIIQKEGVYLIIKALEDAAKNRDVLLTVLTGTGDYFSSGLDIKNLAKNLEESDGENLGKYFFNAFIDYPKLLVAIVNGPAIGLPATLIGLCDIVYATENATFVTPFSKLGVCTEGCATYTFPLILGKSKANEMLLVGHKMTAEEALQFGFVSRVFKQSEIHKIWELVSQFKHFSQQSIQGIKKLSRSFNSDTLKRVNEAEMKIMPILVQSEEFTNAVAAFINRKSKL